MYFIESWDATASADSTAARVEIEWIVRVRP